MHILCQIFTIALVIWKPFGAGIHSAFGGASDCKPRSWITTQLHTFVEIDHEIISRIILHTDSRWAVVSYWQMYVYKYWLTNCILNRLSHTIYWKCPISILGTSGYEIYIFLEKNGQTICKQWRTWSDATFCGIWSGSALFAKYPFTGLPTTMG